MFRIALERDVPGQTAAPCCVRTLASTASLAVALAVPTVASADELYSSFGPGDSYNTLSFWENGPFGTLGGFTAMPFELDAGEFTNIAVTMPLTQSINGDASAFAFQVRIYADDGTPGNAGKYPGVNAPGSLVGSVGALASELPLRQSGAVALTTFDFEQLTLSGETRYWLTIETPMDSSLLFSSIDWYLNDQGVDDYKAQRAAIFPYTDFQNEPWDLLGPGEAGAHGAMRVTGAAAPAPAGLVALLGGGLTVRRRRRR